MEDAAAEKGWGGGCVGKLPPGWSLGAVTAQPKVTDTEGTS